jgi:hypothetical protein
MSNPFKKVPWRKVFDVTSNIIATLVPEVGRIEELVKTIPHIKDLTGAEKKAAVLSVVKGALENTESLTNKDLLDDAEVAAAAGGVIDAVVALQNIIAAKKAAHA